MGHHATVHDPDPMPCVLDAGRRIVICADCWERVERVPVEDWLHDLRSYQHGTIWRHWSWWDDDERVAAAWRRYQQAVSVRA